MSKFLQIAMLSLLCQACVSTSPNSSASSDEEAAVANLNLGVGYLRQGRPELAVDILERALDYDPRLSDGHSALAVAYDQLGRAEDAEEHYRRAAELAPGNPGAANSYAVFLCRNGRWDDAEDYFVAAAESPRYATPEAALANAGVCALSAGDTDTAEKYFREALARNPEYPDALFHMTDLAYSKGNFLQARAFMQRSFDTGSESPEMLSLCVSIEGELNGVTEAQRCATRLKQQFPESTEASELFELERNVTER